MRNIWMWVLSEYYDIRHCRTSISMYISKVCMKHFDVSHNIRRDIFHQDCEIRWAQWFLIMKLYFLKGFRKFYINLFCLSVQLKFLPIFSVEVMIKNLERKLYILAAYNFRLLWCILTCHLFEYHWFSFEYQL